MYLAHLELASIPIILNNVMINPYEKCRRCADLLLTNDDFSLALQDGKQAAVPKLDELLAPDSDSEEEPDLELQLPANKVKYMVGQGGDKIKYIQRKTKCRIQVRTPWHHCCCIPCELGACLCCLHFFRLAFTG